MATTHPPELLETLRQFDAPTIANAIEIFNIRPRNTGFMNAEYSLYVPRHGRDGRLRLYGDYCGETSAT